jgi:AraC-like DNA-binding protein/TolB-like protein
MEHASTSEEQFLKKLTEITVANLHNEQFGVNQLAQKAGMSRSQIHRRLKAISNKSVSQFIREVRLEKAKEFLEEGNLTGSEIAYKVGFGSPSYFIKSFHDYFGYPPGEHKSNAIKEIIKQDNSNSEETVTQSTTIHFSKKYFRLAVIMVIIISAAILLPYFVKNKLFTIYSQKSLAVLPVNNLTGTESADYIVDGLQDAIIGELGRINSIRIISRTSTLRYRDSYKLLKEIADELDVNTIMESSVTTFGDSIRMIIQVIDVFPKERHVLVKEYNDEMKNVLSLQSAMVKDIAHTINAKLTKHEERRLTRSRTVNTESYKAYLRGMYYLGRGEPDLFDKGIQYLRVAIDKDSADPFAYAALALGYANAGHGDMRAEEAFNEALYCANRAIELDSTIDEAYIAKALLYLYHYWEWDKAKEAFSKALKRNPNNDIAHAHFAWYYVLYSDWEKAIYHAREATILNPLNIAFKSWLALIYNRNKEYDKAEKLAKQVLAENENAHYASIVFGEINLVKKNFGEALSYFEKLPQWDYYKLYLADAYMWAGHREKARLLRDNLEGKANNQYIHEWKRGLMAAILGYKDEAFKYINIAIDKKQYPIDFLYTHPMTKSLRDDPRYNELLVKMNLPSD